MIQQYNIVDIVFIVSALILILLATIRGIVKEVFAIINWTAAFLASYLLASPLTNFAIPYFDINNNILSIIINFIIFTTVFIIMILSTSSIVKDLSSSIPKQLNRFFGFIFGILKTMIIFGLIYGTYLAINTIAGGSKINNRNQAPQFIATAKTGKIIEFCGTIMQPLVSGFINSIYKNYSSDLLDIMQTKTTEQPTNNNSLDSGYQKQDIQKLQNIIQIIN
jgi:membrane protein required for colicin V production